MPPATISCALHVLSLDQVLDGRRLVHRLQIAIHKEDLLMATAAVGAARRALDTGDVDAGQWRLAARVARAAVVVNAVTLAALGRRDLRAGSQ